MFLIDARKCLLESKSVPRGRRNRRKRNERRRGSKGRADQERPTRDALNNVFQYAASSRCPTGKLVARKSMAFGKEDGGGEERAS
ncbi:hypothetical protein V1477_018517 [Vespula maculifrons]|uniref:Uncharacterized protein n=3 Tax=Vespula TaxID=7451 RepID=A0A834U6N2_VESGE|nr:hypothetical protein HZH66_001125 [Vespula vulgaris]KAF7418576.1 hypothetical protein HZH68_001229 [Vespula germanica]